MIDARRCLGPVSCVFAVEQASAKARAQGIGCAAVRNGNDVGPSRRLRGWAGARRPDDAAAGERCRRRRLRRALRQRSALPQHQSARLRHPARAGRAAAGDRHLHLRRGLGKIRMAANQGEAVPEGWLIDRAGRTTTEPAGFFDSPRTASLLPLGGAADGHKGFFAQPHHRGLRRRAGGRGHEPGQPERGPGQRSLRARRRPAGARHGRRVRPRDGGIRGRAGGAPSGRGQRWRAPARCARGRRARAVPSPSTGPTWARITAILDALSLGRDYDVTPAAGGER